ncbi:MAG TPA: hypothetical protein EYP80_01215 [Candidatus Aenigmarchaeota archaeon]|nr:hypothetical protein [Candidatus Aenigmarchaeota archaeon]
MTLFDMKRVAFENAVRRCSKRLGLKSPAKISITEKPCPISSDEIAHIHVEERIICIWKKKLEELTLDEIDKVAAHEVAHLVSIEHGGKHAQAQSELEIGIWSQSVGGVVIDGGKEVTTAAPDKPKKSKRRKKICSHHLCKKRKGLQFCAYCERFFCKEHIKPNSPTLPPFEYQGVIGRIRMEDWRGPGHACPPYYDYLQIKKREDLEKRREALNRMRGFRPAPREIKYPEPALKEYTWEERQPRDYSFSSAEVKKKIKTSHAPRRTSRVVSSILIWLTGLLLPFIVGLTFVYLLTPGMSQFTALIGTNNTPLLLTSAFLSPLTSMISWLAWIVSGFVGGLILKRVLIPFLSTYGLAWLVFYIVGGEQLSTIIGLIGGTAVIQVMALNAFVALLAFGFGGSIGSNN